MPNKINTYTPLDEYPIFNVLCLALIKFFFKMKSHGNNRKEYDLI